MFRVGALPRNRTGFICTLQGVILSICTNVRLLHLSMAAHLDTMQFNREETGRKTLTHESGIIILSQGALVYTFRNVQVSTEAVKQVLSL